MDDIRREGYRPYTAPATGERRPVELMDVGGLPWGTANPAQRGFDDRHLADARGTVLELRVPWSSLTFGDPSSHTVYVPHRDGTVTGEHVGRLGIVAARGRQVLPTSGYDWEDWNRVTWHEEPPCAQPGVRRRRSRVG